MTQQGLAAQGTAPRRSVIDVLEIGRVRLEGVQALVLDDKALQTSLIGMSALNRLARFKVEGKVLLLEQ